MVEIIKIVFLEEVEGGGGVVMGLTCKLKDFWKICCCIKSKFCVESEFKMVESK